MRETVLVVGGSSGIGASIAQLCRANGHDVLTAQRRADSDGAHHLDLRDDPAEVKARAAGLCRIYNPRWLVISGGVGAFTNPLLDMEQLAERTQTNWLGEIIEQNFRKQTYGVNKLWTSSTKAKAIPKNRVSQQKS